MLDPAAERARPPKSLRSAAAGAIGAAMLAAFVGASLLGAWADWLGEPLFGLASHVAMQTAGFAALMLASHFGLARFLASRVAAPVEAVARRMAGGGGPVPATGISEIDALSAAAEAALAERDAAAAKAASDARAKLEFLSRMSHELRTPLNGILGLARMLEHGCDGEQADHIRTMIGAGERMAAIIGATLEFSRLESGQAAVVETDTFTVDTLLDGLASGMGAMARSRDLDLVVSAAGMPRSLVGDCGKVGQILSILIDNSLKFTPRGEIEVLARLAGPAAGGMAEVAFSVRDTGIGMAPEALAAAADPFGKGFSRTRTDSGIGLGLAVATRLAEAMGGKLTGESAPGRGTTFTFSASFGLSADVSGNQPAEGLAGLKAMVVDDCEAARKSIAEHARGIAGWTVAEAASGIEAFDLCLRAVDENEPFDLLFVDSALAGMDGRETIRALRDEASLAGCMPAFILVEPCEPGDAGDADAVAGKPVTKSMALDAAMTALRNAGKLRTTARKRSALRPLKGLSILLAEDNHVNRVVGVRALQDQGARVTTANDGLESVAAAKAGPDDFDAILMDIHMPGMDGLEAARAIRMLGGRLVTIPIIALTANALEQDIEQARAAGMDSHVSKPFNPEELVGAILARTGPGTRDHDESPAVRASGGMAMAKEASRMTAIDAHAGLERHTFSEADYVAALEWFAMSQANAAKRTMAALASGDRDGAVGHVHDLIAVAGNIGANEVCALASKMQQALKKHEDEEARGLGDSLAAALDRAIEESLMLAHRGKIGNDVSEGRLK